MNTRRIVANQHGRGKRDTVLPATTRDGGPDGKFRLIAQTLTFLNGTPREWAEI